MANPFPTKFDSECAGCGETVYENDDMFYDRGEYVCPACAAEQDVVCECGQYKKPEFETCYECKMEKYDQPF